MSKVNGIFLRKKCPLLADTFWNGRYWDNAGKKTSTTCVIDNRSHMWYNCLQTLHNGRRLIYSLAKGGGHMRITFHIGDFTVTIIVKKRENRHSAK